MSSFTTAPIRGFLSGFRIGECEFAIVRMIERPGLKSSGDENQAPRIIFRRRFMVGKRERHCALGCAWSWFARLLRWTMDVSAKGRLRALYVWKDVVCDSP
jgi:hypothetical protein